MEVVAIIPIKGLTEAKSRFKPFLNDTQRRRLVKSMLRHVIRAARGAGAEVWVLGTDDATRNVALEECASWRRDAGTGVNQSLRLVFEEAWNAGESPLFLPGDLPFVTSKSLEGLLTAADTDTAPAIVLSPAKSGGGTNAILIPQRLPFQFQLGPDSFSRHVAEAHRLCLHISIYDSPGLARDLDTWQDLQEYEKLHPGFLAEMTHGED